MADFARLIDAETWTFIHQTERWYPLGTTEKTVHEQRGIYDAMCRQFFRGYPQGVCVENRDAGGVRVRHSVRTGANQRALVLYFHGGGFIVGGLDSHDDICAEICDASAFDVVSVACRLCPEHLHPAAFDDAMTACAWATATIGKPVILVGRQRWWQSGRRRWRTRGAARAI